jgi:hypothetical protein
VAELGQPHVAHRPQRQCDRAQPVPGRRARVDRVRGGLAGAHPAGQQSTVAGTTARSTVGTDGPAGRRPDRAVDPLGRPGQHLRRR